MVGDLLALEITGRVILDPVNVLFLGGLMAAGVILLKALVKRLSNR